MRHMRSLLRLLVTGSILWACAAAARPAARQSGPALVIRAVTLIDGTGRAPLANATVVVEGGRIARVATDSAPPPSGATIVDGRGKFLIPGLIDVHVHLRGGGNRASEQP